MTGPTLHYVKGHGTGNDFILLPDPDGELELSDALVRRLCDRHTGLGADGVLRVVLVAASGEPRPDGDARWFMDHRNADGSRPEMCGNGIRVFARYLVDAGYATSGSVPIATRSGVRTVDVNHTSRITVDMGPAQARTDTSVTVTTPARSFTGWPASVGNPHVVVVCDDDVPLADLDLTRPPGLDPPVEAGANVEFVRLTGPDRLAMRVFERGVGETAACGTGACAAAAVAAALAGRPEASYVIDLAGGEVTVDLRAGRAALTGDAVLVASGTLHPGWLAGG